LGRIAPSRDFSVAALRAEPDTMPLGGDHPLAERAAEESVTIAVVLAWEQRSGAANALLGGFLIAVLGVVARILVVAFRLARREGSHFRFALGPATSH
jgi:hypothetical protein